MPDTNSKRLGQTQLPEAREFDFLEGEWDAICAFPRPDGSWGEGPGRLKATKILDGCASMEFFEGTYQGESIKGRGVTERRGPRAGGVHSDGVPRPSPSR